MEGLGRPRGAAEVSFFRIWGFWGFRVQGSSRNFRACCRRDVVAAYYFAGWHLDFMQSLQIP